LTTNKIFLLKLLPYRNISQQGGQVLSGLWSTADKTYLNVTNFFAFLVSKSQIHFVFGKTVKISFYFPLSSAALTSYLYTRPETVILQMRARFVVRGVSRGPTSASTWKNDSFWPCDTHVFGRQFFLKQKKNFLLKYFNPDREFIFLPSATSAITKNE
jgi:hypothetical protein